MKGLSFIFILGAFLFPALSRAQQATGVLQFEPFLQWVTDYHPVSQQAGLRIQAAQAGVMVSRGQFDPVLKSGLDEKNFDDKLYYSHLESSLSVPTRTGVSFKAAYDRANGQYLNPEEGLPGSGLLTMGLTVPLGQGLLFDKRRAELQQAFLNEEMSEANARAMRNDLLWQAARAYWNWVKAGNQLVAAQEVEAFAAQRMTMVTQSWQAGELAALDTVEALSILLQRQAYRQEMELKFRKAGFELSNFLWSAEGLPLELSADARPPLLDTLPLPLSAPGEGVSAESAVRTHPVLSLYEFKVKSAGIDRRIKLEGVKPKLNLNYNFLSAGAAPALSQPLFASNYKLGFDFSMPLFLRTARAELRQARIKISDAQLSLNQKSLELENKLLQAQAEWQLLRTQADLQLRTSDAMRQMLLGEQSRFEAGESSLFVVNQRETNYLSAKMKWLEVHADAFAAASGVTWAAGLLGTR